MTFILIAALTIILMLIHIYIFTLVGKKTLTLSGISGEILYIFSYFYFASGAVIIFFGQGDVQKQFEASVTWQIGISPAIIGLFSGLWIFRKDIKLIKSRSEIKK
jgi:hypothetical protein